MSSYHKQSTGHVCPNGLSRRIQSETANVCLILQSTRIFFRFIFVLPFCLYGSLREWMQIFVALQVPRQQHDLTIFFELKSYSDDLFNCTNTSSQIIFIRFLQNVLGSKQSGSKIEVININCQKPWLSGPGNSALNKVM